MVLLKLSLVLGSLFFGSTTAVLKDGRRNGNMMPRPLIPMVVVPTAPVISQNGTQLPPYDTTYYFDQLIDHTNPSLGTFKQRYWHTWEWYKTGGPIIITTPGEGNAEGYEGYLTNVTINGQIAQQQNGATIVIEHRFYGLSNPYPDLSVQSLQVHTIQQAIEDLVYFAENVNLPMPNGSNVPPTEAPWVLIGGSYAGALTGWTMHNKPGVFWAGYSSSGVVEAMVNYWSYFEPIRIFMPKNCSADVEAVTAYFDKVFTSGNTTVIAALKDSFGMANVTHLDDAAGALRNNLLEWQDLQPTTGPNGGFYQFCDALEVENGKNAPASGWGLQHALAAWGSYFKNTYLPSDGDDCLGTYDPTQSYYTDTSIDNSGRSWEWIVCNEVGYFQESPPVGRPAIVSRLIQPIYDERICTYFFPEQFKTAPVPRANVTNQAYGGWNLKVDRLFFANGLRDPWRDVTVSADGLYRASTPMSPIVEGDGFHCSDLGTSSAKVDPTIAKVQKEALEYMKVWIPQYRPSGHGSRPYSSQPGPGSNPPPAPKFPNQPINAWFKGFGSFSG